MVTLVVVDNHESESTLTRPCEVPSFSSEEEFISILSGYLQGHYDALISDARADGYIASILYGLHRQATSLHYRCFRVPLSKDMIEVFKNKGIHTILALDWFPFYGCDMTLFDKVILLNPSQSKILEGVNVAELVYRAASTTTPFMRDLAALASAEYNHSTSRFLSVQETIAAYPSLFPTLQQASLSGKLTRYAILQSLFLQLSDLFRAPSALQGEQGVQELVRLALASTPFTYFDILNFAHHPVVKYLRKEQQKLDSILERELTRCENTCKIKGMALLYEPQEHSPRFLQKLSRTLCKKYIGTVIILKIPVNGKTKYSLSHRGLLVNLGALLESIGVGGGYATNAGALVENTEQFETELITRLEKAEEQVLVEQRV